MWPSGLVTCWNCGFSGLANPAPIIQTFFLEEELSEGLRLDGVVTVTDAKHVARHFEAQKPDGVVNEAVEQIAFADRIIVNKVGVHGGCLHADCPAPLSEVADPVVTFEAQKR